jgi:FkbM family methyltransferase
MSALQRAQALINSLLAPLDIMLERRSVVERLQMEANAVARQSPRDLELLRGLRSSETLRLLEILPRSSSQARQDIFVLDALGFKEQGYFVEFGAADGIKTSNTYLLENSFGWTGILLEPARVWHDRLRRNRSAVVDTRCVWSDSDSMLTFVERELAGRSSVATIPSAQDDTVEEVGVSRTYPVQTVSLLDGLRQHDAPPRIDYLSVDTEGSEFAILDAFDFGAYRFSVITCEHNYGASRELIHELLSRHGYRRVHEEFSQFDDWYVDATILPEYGLPDPSIG